MPLISLQYIDSTIPLLSVTKAISFQPGLCLTWSETPKTGFLAMPLEFPEVKQHNQNFISPLKLFKAWRLILIANTCPNTTMSFPFVFEVSNYLLKSAIKPEILSSKSLEMASSQLMKQFSQGKSWRLSCNYTDVLQKDQPSRYS